MTLDLAMVSWKPKEKNKLGFLKIKNFCAAKDITKKYRRQFTEWKKIFLNYISDKCIESSIKNSWTRKTTYL